MICPDLTIHYIIVKWMFDIFQIVAIILVWKLVEYLWRLTSPKD